MIALLIDFVGHSYEVKVIWQIEISLVGAELHLDVVLVLLVSKIKLLGVNECLLDLFYLVIINQVLEKEVVVVNEIVLGN